MNRPAPLRIDFVSDVACPWCAIGLASLREALDSLDGVNAEIHLQPFELNPQMSFDGEDAAQHLMRKYGMGEEQLEANRKVIRDRAAQLGVTINHAKGSRVWNTFDAHRLLHWAGLLDWQKAIALKQALFASYFDKGENVADPTTLLQAVDQADLDVEAARRVLDSGEYADAVRALEQRYQQSGIHSVPATIINNQWLISGGQPPEAFAKAIREIAANQAAQTIN